MLCAAATALSVEVTSGFPQASAHTTTSALKPAPIAISFLVDRIVWSSAENNLRAQEPCTRLTKRARVEGKRTLQIVNELVSKKHTNAQGNNYAGVKKGGSRISFQVAVSAWQQPT